MIEKPLLNCPWRPATGMQRQESGYAEVESPDESHNVSFLLTLLTMLDFTNPGQVQKEDWERGVAALHAPGLSWEVSWQMLLRRFDLDFNGSIDFGEMHGLAPLDPRLGSLLRPLGPAVVHAARAVCSSLCVPLLVFGTPTTSSPS